MNISTTLQTAITEAVKSLYGLEVAPGDLSISVTKKEFEGDYTLVVFPFVKAAKKAPSLVGQEIGDYLLKNVPQLARFNVIQGFLNLTLSDGSWREFLLETAGQASFGVSPPNGRRVMIEYCSPNTNKPLHLGHVRNILLGWACTKIYEAAGYEVIKAQIVNDRGIAICKSMLAWQKWGEGATPESTGIKSDHFVGDYYVMFESKFRGEYKAWQQSEAGQAVLAEKRKPEQSESDFFGDYKNLYFNQFSELGKQAREMLLRWEAGDPDILALWGQMNGWVYQGFEETYRKLGVSFDKFYYESDTYLLGRDTVEKGLANGAFYQKPDGSVWVDLTDAKLDHKLLLRSDGTSIYITQDLGTAQMRHRDYGAEKVVYVVADEQNYHFQVLFEVLKRLGEPYADGLFHLSYGMVDLPTGRMKSREGTVVDADDLIAEVIAEAKEESKERGEIAELPPAQQEDIIRRLGLAALKFHIVKVHPKKRMVFDPKESVELQGQTGPYIQNAYVRIRSVIRKGQLEAGALSAEDTRRLAGTYPALETQEKDLIAQLYRYPELVQAAAQEFDPSIIANFCYDLAKSFHKFYSDYSILKAESAEAKAFRLMLSEAVASVLEKGMGLLGIEMPDRM